MTVEELIEKLKEFPKDLPVYMYVYGEEKEVEKAETQDAFGCADSCVELL